VEAISFLKERAMHTTRLAAAGAVAALVALGMAGPAQAAEPAASATPDPFKPGADLTLSITECTETPTSVAGDLFTGTPQFSGEAGGTWTAKQATKPALAPGKSFTITINCKVGEAPIERTVTVTSAKEEPNEPPAFSFGFDDVKMSTTRVVPNGSTTFTVTCPTAVTINSNAYTTNPLPVTKSGENTWTSTGKFKSSLPNPSVVTIACKDHGAVEFTTNPEKGEMKPGKKIPGKIPTGRIDTGDGSTQTGTGMPLLAGGTAALAAAGLGAVALRRRIGRERS
jgi:hypothetical protein